MDNAKSPLERAFNSFLLNMPPQQLEELLKYINDTKTKDDSRKNENSSTRFGGATGTNHGSTVIPGSNSRSVNSRSKRVNEGKRRPLNSFIAFRSFYSVIFPDLTQKAKSGILRFLWQNDPFKAKWTILAKAYSIIRDDHDNEVSLESFLSLNTDLIGIIEPDRYLDVMGWQLNVDGEQQYTMARVKSPSTADADLSTNYSVNDIIKNCYATGYVSELDRKNNETQKDLPVMAFAAQPTLVVHERNNVQVSGDHTIISSGPNGSSAMGILSPAETESLNSPESSSMSPFVDESSFYATDVSGAFNFTQFQESQRENYFDIPNFPFSNWNEDASLFPVNAAPMMQESLDSFDFNPFINF